MHPELCAQGCAFSFVSVGPRYPSTTGKVWGAFLVFTEWVCVFLGDNAAADHKRNSFAVQLMILARLDVRSVLNVSQTCSEMHALCGDWALWRQLYLKHYGREFLCDLSSNTP